MDRNISGLNNNRLRVPSNDHLKIKYVGKDLLYVPIEQMDLVQKYIGSDQGIPKLEQIRRNRMEKGQSQSKGAIADMAEELLKLNAMRQTAQGYAFSPGYRLQNNLRICFMRKRRISFASKK